MEPEEDITLRNFSLKDTKVLEGFQKESVPISFPGIKPNLPNFKKNLFKYFKKEPDGIAVLEKDGEVIGYIWLNTKYNSFRKKRYGLIRKLYIKNAYRGRGLAKRLLKFAEEYFEKKKAKYIELKVTLTIRAAVDLYKKAGYLQKRIILEKRL